MTAYLQRLLERAAPVAAAPRPALASGSPVVAFDQRLGDPGLADDYALTGAPPPEPAFPEGGSWAPLTPAPPAEPGAAAVEPRQRRAEPRRGATVVATTTSPKEDGTAPEPPPRPSIDAKPGAVDAPGVATARPADSAPPPPTVVAVPPEPATPTPPQSEPSAVAHRFETRVERVREPTILELVTKPEREAISRAEPARSIVERASVPDPVAPDPIEVEPARPATQAGLARPVSPDAGPTAQPPPLAEPVVAEPPPLAAPAASIDMSAIERLVAEAVRAERAREKAVLPRPLAASAARSEVVADAAAPPRPASAAEASVIGKLQTSAFRPMLFGVRRR